MSILIINTVEGVVVGQYGQTIALNVYDSGGNAADLSSYTVAVLRAQSPDAQSTIQLTGAITSSTGGALTVTPDTATYFDVAGNWEGQIAFSDTGILAYTQPFTIEVAKQI